MAITKRLVKGDQLNYVELDENFTTLEAADTALAAADAAHAALTAAHGVSGDVVGTTDTQTLSNKTLSSPAIDGTVTTTGLTLPAHSSGAINGTTIPTSKTLADTDSAQALTNKTLVAASNTVTTAASGNLVATELNAALAELQGDIDTRATSAALAASSGSSLVGFLQSGTGAVARTAQDKLRDVVSAKDFGAVGDGVTDDTSALAAALLAASGRRLYIKAGTYLTDGLTVPADTFVYGDGSASVLKKRSNGDTITLGLRSTLSNFKIDGDGATYTGRGVVVSSGTPDNNSWVSIQHLVIADTNSYCLEFTTANAGYFSEVIGGKFNVYNNTVEAIKLPTVEAANGNRRFIGVMAGASSIIDLGGSDNTTVIGCEGSGITYSATTKKARVIGNRIASATSLTFDGTSNVFGGNVCTATSVTLNAGLASLQMYGNNFGSGVSFTDNATAANGNDIYSPSQTYTPVWTGGSPTIGDGSLNGQYSRRGQYAKVNIQLTGGSTTTWGSGAWTFSLPYSASRNFTGSAYIEDASGVSVYVGVAYLVSGSNAVYVVTNGSTSSYVGSASPMAWAQSDKLYIDIEYLIS